MPASKDPKARRRQLANLKPGEAAKHGVYSETNLRRCASSSSQSGYGRGFVKWAEVILPFQRCSSPALAGTPSRQPHHTRAASGDAKHADASAKGRSRGLVTRTWHRTRSMSASARALAGSGRRGLIRQGRLSRASGGFQCRTESA
jgi:hypothetical protein